VVPNVRAKGKASVRVADILNRMQVEEPVNSSDVIMHYFKLLFKQINLKMRFYQMMFTSLHPIDFFFFFLYSSDGCARDKYTHPFR
jgi:hypothetical protein